MDIHDLWQENKRWLLGVVLGLMVYWIGTSVIGGVYETRAVSKRINSARTTLRTNEFFGDDALAAAKDEADALEQSRDRLERALAFTAANEFTLEGKGTADLHYDQVRRRVRRDLMTRAEALGVEVAPKDLQWANPKDRSETESTLIALHLLEAAMTRLLDAHEAVLAADPQARGVAAIESLRIDGGRPGARRPSRSRRRGDQVDVDDLIREDRLRFKVLADEASTRAFLEACRAQQPPITLVDFKMTSPQNVGDALSVSGTLSALRILEKKR